MGRIPAQCGARDEYVGEDGLDVHGVVQHYGVDIRRSHLLRHDYMLAGGRVADDEIGLCMHDRFVTGRKISTDGSDEVLSPPLLDGQGIVAVAVRTDDRIDRAYGPNDLRGYGRKGHDAARHRISVDAGVRSIDDSGRFSPVVLSVGPDDTRVVLRGNVMVRGQRRITGGVHGP